MNLVFGNIDYLQHTSTEGQELQDGLVAAGWAIAGPGFPDSSSDVPALLKRYRPERVFVQDCRDWLPESNISFRKDIGYRGMRTIGEAGIPAFTIIKDAWGWKDLQSRLAHDIRAAAIACYYRPEMVREQAGWIKPSLPLLRIHHSVNRDVIEALLHRDCGRRPALVSGFLQPCYPLRTMAFAKAGDLGLDVLRHPGYGNRGQDTPTYLAAVSGYKVHLATASQWGCAFRKIIESVACGVTPVTNLPPSDVLPEIDGALVRIPSTIGFQDLKQTIAEAVRRWDWEERRAWATKALDYYDWRPSGRRLDALMEAHVPNPTVA